MFQKPTFGSNTANFGSFNTGASTSFGGFKPTATTGAFGGTPTFGGGATAQNTTGGGLFGSTSTTGGLFGSNTTATTSSGFGASTSGFGFGANTSKGGLFTGNTSGGLFGQQQPTGTFGAKPPGFGFGGTSSAGTTGGLFGSTSSPGSGLFGQQNTSGGGLFSNTNVGFGQQQAQTGTAHVKFNPVVGSDVVVKGGSSQNINIKHHCITCMKEYENKSLEELRLEDYIAGRKGQAKTNMFGFQQQQQQTENKPLFGGSTFGQPATTSAPGVFGASGLGTGTGFGQTSAFSFGGNTQTSTAGGLFGANKPAFGTTNTTGGGLFGTTTTTQAPAFGTNTSTFGGFGTNTQNQNTSLFGAKPATTGFGATSVSSGFGSFGTSTGSTLFGPRPAQTQASTFGTTQPAFGTLGGGGGFGTTTSTAGGGLFGGNTFGKPATSQPSFGFSQQQTTLGGGLGGGLGANAFQAKPAAPAFGGGSLFSNTTPAANTFKADSGLGGGLFSNTATLGSSMGGMSNFNMTTNPLASNTIGASAAGNVHEQILALAARPYGDSPLFKDLVPDSGSKTEDVLKPTNPAAMKAVLDRSNSSAYKVTSPNAAPLRVRAINLPMASDKKTLFDGLEADDPTLENRLSLKPSRKRLILPKRRTTDTNNELAEERKVEEQSSPLERDGRPTHESPRGKETPSEAMNGMRKRELAESRPEYAANNDLEASSDRLGSWLSGSKVSWGDKEQPIGDEPTPRLYPNLDNGLAPKVSSPTAERRASWLTTKSLRIPMSTTADSTENSVRELGVKEKVAQSGKENIDNLSGVSEDENVAPKEMPPHPTGIKLTRPGYYLIPSLDELIGYKRADGSCVVPHLTIGRKNYGSVYYDCEMDVAGLDMDALVFFFNKEVMIYPDDKNKPPIGEGLNRRAIVTLDRIWPTDKSEKRPITDPERLLSMDYESKLRRVCDKHDTKFIEYRPETGSWVFRVEHFSKYGLTESDDEDEMIPDVLKRQLIANESIQKAALSVIQPPITSRPTSVITGLGGSGTSGGLGGLAKSPMNSVDENYTSIEQTTMDLFNGKNGFVMDTENNTESQSFYQETNREFGVKSPTSELARLEHRQSHNVQLMKASLYADIEMEDDVSVSTGDQLVPVPKMSVSLTQASSLTLPLAGSEPVETVDVQSAVLTIEDLPMKPLIVKPETAVLKYFRKVPPFKYTIAGRLEAACIAEMAINRARHSRVGFGPAGVMAYATSYDSIANLPRTAQLCELGKYVCGRGAEDWSEPTVARLAIGQASNMATAYAQEALGRHLDALLEFSMNIECGDNVCPRLETKQEVRSRLELLRRHLKEAEATTKLSTNSYGVSSSYCHEVWSLCEALWGADLENDGIPGTDVQSIVTRHNKFLQWLKEAVSEITDEELATSTPAEPEDETDGHSAHVWTLLLGGRILEACKVARKNGDLNMATLLAQAPGDPVLRSLISRQLSLWRECGALELISTHKRAILKLISGLSTPDDLLSELDWMRALHATARYLCPPVPSLESVIRKYESFFSTPTATTTSADLEEWPAVDLTIIDDHPSHMKHPLPTYCDDYDVNVYKNGEEKRILDLRYELIRARAFNRRPRLQPASWTPDPLDYSLHFLLSTWLGTVTSESVCGVAAQLEAVGEWHRAIQALLYHPDDVARGHLVRGVLSRHAPSRADTPELKKRLELVRRLRVPEKWVLIAQAHRAKYENLPAVEIEHLVGAEQWNAAHRVLVEQLLPTVVLSGPKGLYRVEEFKAIAAPLERLHEAANRSEISEWQSGGEALYYYIQICDEIRDLVSSASGSVGEAGSISGESGEFSREATQCRLESLNTKLYRACNAVARLKTRTPLEKCARAEMGTRLVRVALAATQSAKHLSAMLAALNLPPDCTVQAHHKITMELAEQASESCSSTMSRSLLSSNQRALMET